MFKISVFIVGLLIWSQHLFAADQCDIRDNAGMTVNCRAERKNLTIEVAGQDADSINQIKRTENGKIIPSTKIYEQFAFEHAEIGVFTFNAMLDFTTVRIVGIPSTFKLTEKNRSGYFEWDGKFKALVTAVQNGEKENIEMPASCTINVKACPRNKVGAK